MSVDSVIMFFLGVVVLVLAGAILILMRRQSRSNTSALLDQQLGSMNLELGKVSDLVRELEKDREGKFGELSAQLKSAAEQTAALSSTTGALREALANSRARGQWGERMAEDVLRLIGFVEGVNYVKQKSMDDSNSRPDFTFFLPKDLKLNMDVKFPLDNYLRSVNSESADEELRYRSAFLRDVRGRLNEVATKDYIDAKQSTLGCVLLFIPNEQIYQFIQEHDHALIDESMKKQVVLCSPMSLFAILAVIRQAVDNFTVEQTSNQIIAELGLFNQQWDQFLKKLDDVGKRIDASQREYQTLITTRRRALERPLNRIDDLRRSRGISLPEDEALAEPDSLYQPLLESLTSGTDEQ
jgi:DNA recombination protein RmuC